MWHVGLWGLVSWVSCLLLLAMDFFLRQALSVFCSLFDNDPVLQHPIIAVAPAQMEHWISLSKCRILQNNWRFKIAWPKGNLAWYVYQVTARTPSWHQQFVPSVNNDLQLGASNHWCWLTLDIQHVQFWFQKNWVYDGVHFSSIRSSLSENQPSLRVIFTFSFFLITSSNCVKKRSWEKLPVWMIPTNIAVPSTFKTN